MRFPSSLKSYIPSKDRAPTPNDASDALIAADLDFFGATPSVDSLATATPASTGSATGNRTGSIEAGSTAGSVPGSSVVPPSPEGGVVGDVTRFLTER